MEQHAEVVPFFIHLIANYHDLSAEVLTQVINQGFGQVDIGSFRPGYKWKLCPK